MAPGWIRYSERFYNWILGLYPDEYRQEFGAEMAYVFSESLRETYREQGVTGIVTYWIRIFFDAGRSIINEYISASERNTDMKTQSTDIVMQNKIFGWMALGTIALLLIPLALMTLNIPILDPGSGYEVINWSPFDFVAMGILLFGSGSLFVFAARKVRKKYRLAVAAIAVLGFLWLWAELAVGVFTNWGS